MIYTFVDLFHLRYIYQIENRNKMVNMSNNTYKRNIQWQQKVDKSKVEKVGTVGTVELVELVETTHQELGSE